MSFTVDLKKENNKATILMEGGIDEDSIFPKIDLSGVEREVVVDLAKVEHINSIGIRSWLNWFKPMATKYKFVLINCPRVVVMQMNMVDGFLPVNSRVESFFVPYYCETCDLESEVLFRVGKEVTLQNGAVKIDYSPQGTCKTPDCAIEIDANEAKYFRFLALS